MADTIIWCCLCLILGLWLGFMLCMILTFGSLRKWHEGENAYRSGWTDGVRETYTIVSEMQSSAIGIRWSALNEVLDVISEMLPV